MSVFGAVASLPQTVMNLINPHSKTNTVNSPAKNHLRAADSTGGTSTTGTTSTSTAAQATTDIGTTFLSLLTKELQNQDPTAPMDSTQMVGQMISLNQLDELIAINQNLTPTTATATSGTGATSGVKVPVDSSAQTLAAQQALLASAQPAAGNTAASLAAQLSADSTLNAAAQSVGNAGTLNLTNFNSMFGGNK